MPQFRFVCRRPGRAAPRVATTTNAAPETRRRSTPLRTSSRANRAGAKGVIAARTRPKDGDSSRRRRSRRRLVQAVHRPAGRRFLIVDPSLQAGHGMQVPMGLSARRPMQTSRPPHCHRQDRGCRRQDAHAGAKDLFGIKELSTVVVNGTANRDDKDNLTVLARGLYVRPGPAMSAEVDLKSLARPGSAGYPGRDATPPARRKRHLLTRYVLPGLLLAASPACWRMPPASGSIRRGAVTVLPVLTTRSARSRDRRAAVPGGRLGRAAAAADARHRPDRGRRRNAAGGRRAGREGRRPGRAAGRRRRAARPGRDRGRRAAPRRRAGRGEGDRRRRQGAVGAADAPTSRPRRGRGGPGPAGDRDGQPAEPAAGGRRQLRQAARKSTGCGRPAGR